MIPLCGRCNKQILHTEVSPYTCRCGHRTHFKPIPTPPLPSQPKKGKPGTELKKLIPKFFKSKECKCSEYVIKMDAWGIEGCESRFNEIVSHLVSQAGKARIIKYFPGLNRRMACCWLKKAINNAKENIK